MSESRVRVAALVAGGFALAMVGSGSTLTASGVAGADDADRVAAKAATYRVSIGNGGVQADGASGAAAVSGDCGLVAFTSVAKNLVARNVGKQSNVFARDRETKQTLLVSQAPGGKKTNGYNRPSSVSADGQFVVYDSGATNLVPNDDTTVLDVYVRDLTRKRSELISVATDGEAGDGESVLGSISADGRYVAFNSAADNLIDGPQYNDIDVFVRDRQEQTTELISVGFEGAIPDNGSGSAEMSGNGRYVLLSSLASNLVEEGVDDDELNDVYRYDRETGEMLLVSVGFDGTNFDDAPVLGDDISSDGRYVSFTTYSAEVVEDDTNIETDVFVRDLETGTNTIVSQGPEGEGADSFNFYSSVSDDGNVVSFDSQAGNLVPGDNNFMVDTYVHYVDSGVTKRASVSTAGVGARRGGSISEMSDNGKCAIFTSTSANLIPGDTNKTADVILRVLGPKPQPARTQ